MLGLRRIRKEEADGWVLYMGRYKTERLGLGWEKPLSVCLGTFFSEALGESQIRNVDLDCTRGASVGGRLDLPRPGHYGMGIAVRSPAGFRSTSLDTGDVENLG